MILNDTIFPTPVAVANLLHLSEHSFYFTGSRWMGGWKPDSDWDYIAQDSPEVIAYLTGLGFRPKAGFQVYADGLTKDCLEHVSPEGTVQVTLSTDAPRKHQAAVWIRDNEFEKHLAMPKDKRSSYWFDVMVNHTAPGGARVTPLTEAELAALPIIVMQECPAADIEFDKLF